MITALLRMALVPAVLLSGCTAGSEDPVPWEDQGVSSAQWQIRWPADAATIQSNDLGYTVEIDQLWVVVHSVALSQCESVASSWLAPLFDAAIGTAHAAHGGEEEPSQQLLSAAVTPGFDEGTATTEFVSATYCGVWVMLARAEPGTVGPDGDSADGSVLRVEGRWSRGEEEGEIRIDSSLTDSRIRPWAEINQVGSGDHVEVSLDLPATGIWDGLDFAVQNDDALAWGVLENALDGAVISARRE